MPVKSEQVLHPAFLSYTTALYHQQHARMTALRDPIGVSKRRGLKGQDGYSARVGIFSRTLILGQREDGARRCDAAQLMRSERD